MGVLDLGEKVKRLPANYEANLFQRKAQAAEWKLFRKDQGLTQLKLACLLGCSAQTVKRIELGGGKDYSARPHQKVIDRFRILKRKLERLRKCGCGYEYPAHLGKYGCPNCEGEKHGF